MRLRYHQIVLVGDRLLMPLLSLPSCSFQLPPPHLRIFGIQFDGSNSLFATQQFFINEAGNGLFSTHFTPVRICHLRFVNRLLETFCTPYNSCALTGTFPAYTAGVLNSNYRTRLYIARTDSSTLATIYRKVHSFEISYFVFGLTEWLDYELFPRLFHL